MTGFDRRTALASLGGTFGSLALRGLLGQEARAADVVDPAARARDPLALQAPHFAPRAKSVIFLFMYGGPSHVDLFDPKPTLSEYAGKPIPVFKPEDTFRKGSRNVALPSPYKFRRHGEAGVELAEVYPHLSQLTDELCVIRLMHAESNNHGPALFQMQTGSLLSGRPSLGAWTAYGLGNENENLPGFVVMMDHQGAPVNGALNWTNGYMPAAYQGVPFRPTGDPIAYLQPPAGVTDERQRARLDLLQRWNSRHRETNPHDSALSARIASYELAYRMQSHAAEAVDLGQETSATRAMYGLDDKVTAHFGRNCLLARRLVERGVRFVQVYSGGNEGPRAWDAHDDIKKNHDLHCAETDLPMAGLLLDLKQRGLLDSTLVIWGGEFGRTPFAEDGKGRDHHAKAFTMWLAGGGIRGGQVYGETDDFGYNVVRDAVSVPDLHATCLHLLGLDHTRLTFPYLGRNFRLTDVSGNVVQQLLA
ncbi:MAG: DUF1501 domain-containing protein [Planctomycetaceae bacterium]|nr:DUF1501 domain-containing protein [Planctomycetaceae bacterium]